MKVWVDDKAGWTTSSGGEVVAATSGDAATEVRELAEEVYRALLEEAQKHALRVNSHTYYQQDVANLVRHGLNGSIHGIADTTDLSPDVVRLLASREFTYAPTLTAYESRFSYAEGAEF